MRLAITGRSCEPEGGPAACVITAHDALVTAYNALPTLDDIGIDDDWIHYDEHAAEIRAWRKPEPYKGKGIFVNDETIKLKAKKIK